MVDSRSEFNTPDYWRHLGEFVQQFADAEFEAHSALWLLTNRDIRVSAAIFPDKMKIDDVITSLRRAYPLIVSDEQDVSFVLRALDQLKVINGMRNKLLHNGTTFTETGAVVYQRLTALRNEGEAPEKRAVPLEALSAMANDCRTIAGVLFAIGVVGMTKAVDIEKHHSTRNWAYHVNRFR